MTSMNHARWLLATGSVTAGLVLAGCTAPEDEPRQASEPARGATAGEDTEGGDTDTSPTSGAGVAEFDPENVLVEQTVSLAGDPEDKATIGVQSLTVEGKTMVLRLVVTPELSSVSDSETVSLYDLGENSPFAPVLIDDANLKEYSVVRDGATLWASDSVQTETVNGTPMHAWAVYAAPEDDIDTMDVRIRDVWPEFTDIPITR